MGIGRGYQPFSRRNIRAPFQQLRRHTNGYRWRWRCERQRWKTELGRRFADQYRDRMLVLGAGDPNIDHLCSSRFEDRPSLLHFYLGSKTSVVSVHIQLQCLFILRNRILQQFFLGIQGARGEIINSQIGVQTQIHHGQIRGAGLGLLAIRLHPTTHPSPCIDLIRQIKRHGEIVKRNAVKY